jgi:hypothetical protein
VPCITIVNDAPTAFDPLPEFQRIPSIATKDVAAAVEASDRRNGYDHFPTKGISSCGHRRDNRVAVLLHRTRGAERSDDGCAPDARTLPDHRRAGTGGAAWRTRPSSGRLPRSTFAVRHLPPGSARAVLDFSSAGAPAVSVALLLRDRFR